MLRPAASRAASIAVRKASRQSSRAFASVVAEEKDPVDLNEITTLANGVRVVSEALPGPFSGVGVYLEAGSRFENEYLSGVSHIMDRLAFKSTSKRTGDEMLECLESLGGNITCASSREALMYQSATFNSAVPTTVALLAETIRDPILTAEEVEQQLETADYEINEIWDKPELILPELIHVAAYRGNTLGHPLLCPKERLPLINRDVIKAYRDVLYKPERTVVAFAGVDHLTAVKLTEQYFGDMTSSTGPSLSQIGSESELTRQQAVPAQAPQKESRLLDKIPFVKNLSTSASRSATAVEAPTFSMPDLTSPAQYTGGFLQLPPIPPPLNTRLPCLSHIHLAFEGLPISHPDIYALATLQTLLGGGGSFSAGGPGKGMYSRLYTNVLNQFGWVESCVSFNHSYSDSGLFGISASCAPRNVRDMLEVMCRELKQLGEETGWNRLKEGEVSRAKNQLKSNLLMNLESRLVELEDLGRQVQMHGRKVGVREMCENVDKVSIQDLRRVARTVMEGQVRNIGDGSGAPTVVLQEGVESGAVRRKDLQWTEIEERIGNWKLGRR